MKSEHGIPAFSIDRPGRGIVDEGVAASRVRLDPSKRFGLFWGKREKGAPLTLQTYVSNTLIPRSRDKELLVRADGQRMS